MSFGRESLQVSPQVMGKLPSFPLWLIFRCPDQNSTRDSHNLSTERCLDGHGSIPCRSIPILSNLGWMYEIHLQDCGEERMNICHWNTPLKEYQMPKLHILITICSLSSNCHLHSYIYIYVYEMIRINTSGPGQKFDRFTLNNNQEKSPDAHGLRTAVLAFLFGHVAMTHKALVVKKLGIFHGGCNQWSIDLHRKPGGLAWESMGKRWRFNAFDMFWSWGPQNQSFFLSFGCSCCLVYLLDPHVLSSSYPFAK